MNKPVKPLRLASIAATKIAPSKPHTNAEERIYHDVYDAIMEHRLPPRTKLTEQVLCQIYDTARHTVRKVLSRLATEGLVELEANRGAFIASPTTAEARDMFELRKIIEHATLDKVAKSVTPKQLATLRKLVDEERAAYVNGDRPRWIRLSAQFHLELAALTDNVLLVEVLRKLVSRTTLLIAKIEVPGQNACSFDEHESVLLALESGDAAQAQAQMAHHLHNCEERVQPEQSSNFDLRAALSKTL
ncbi:GntR family transcriptional regulator [Glaciimonas immobilis]|uniref:DNA-binding GntR family transcriptional regulator n=1 Tax=Glaciimonas immobilis TaxID=728004 RepID=A0A840RMW0_9BURK|nr:GntR family transcriptional regulator [Glaciimonas immobilis]KAF3996810.1 GntR family transcriptional regulator [Glaciimonas immobilis]MBB5199647.1 DNA-binding GntR family transcriptional regulator [Glaciimonas immobilis]